MPTKRQFSIQVSDEQLAVLDQLAVDNGVSRSTVVVNLITQALAPSPRLYAIPIPKEEIPYFSKATCPVCRAPATLMWVDEGSPLTVSCGEAGHWPKWSPVSAS